LRYRESREDRILQGNSWHSPQWCRFFSDTQARILHFHFEIRFWFISSELHPLHLPVRKQEVRAQFTPHFPISTGKESIRNNQQGKKKMLSYETGRE